MPAETSFIVDTPSGLMLAGVAYAEANWGRWIARCPRPWCSNAMALEVGQQGFICGGWGGCGYAADVIWPPDPQAIEAILAMRPVPRTQNWQQGESLEDLLAENAAHDCLPPEWLALENRTLLLSTTEGRATGGLLHQQLVAAGRREIGA
jgi:hypothetical protein